VSKASESEIMLSGKRTAILGACAVLALLAAGDRGRGGAALAQPAAVTSACPTDTPTGGSTTRVVAAAHALEGLLDAGQRRTINHPLELQYAIRWSNFPAYIVPRNGVPIGDLNPEQTRAAKDLILAAAGACGARLFDENREADILGHQAIRGIDPGLHFISFNGVPSESKPWMLMISGHHLDFNFVFNGPEAGATPLFAGSDPGRFKDAKGVQHEPMARQGAVLADMARAISNYPEAQIPGVYTDLVRSVVSFGGGPPGRGGGAPGGGAFGIDTRYPVTYPAGPQGRGVSYAKLKPNEQALVRHAIESYAALAGRQISAPLLKLYETPEALAQTYVAYSGDTNLVQPRAYVRIDGPRVWIELSVQQSLVDRATTHFHSLWRDKVSDYGGQFRN
jgi:hypothetical protein